jgi:hypothetical protein
MFLVVLEFSQLESSVVARMYQPGKHENTTHLEAFLRLPLATIFSKF